MRRFPQPQETTYPRHAVTEREKGELSTMAMVGECKTPDWLQNTLWRVNRQNESENKAAQLPIFHPAAVAASEEDFHKKETKTRMPRFDLARCSASC